MTKYITNVKINDNLFTINETEDIVQAEETEYKLRDKYKWDDIICSGDINDRDGIYEVTFTKIDIQ